jgi:dihydrofolate reductase
MRNVIYGMNVSIDCSVEGPNGDLDWATPGEELHQYFNDREATIDTHLYGRRMYELMAAFWPTADADPAFPPYIAEYAHLWKDVKKVVFSTTLETVDWNARLVRGNIAEEIAALKRQPGKNMTVGGPTFAASLMRLGLVDEYHVVVRPIILGGGKPMFSLLGQDINLQLVGTRAFGPGAVLLQYRREDA